MSGTLILDTIQPTETDITVEGNIKVNGTVTSNNNQSQLIHSILHMAPYKRFKKDGTTETIICPESRVVFSDGTIWGIGEDISPAFLDNTETFELGTDYYIWAGKGNTASAGAAQLGISSTLVEPIELTSPQIIGGFHYGKVRTGGAPVDVENGILPNSVWDLLHMPECYRLALEDPDTYQLGGMAEVIPHQLWVDIYLASEGGGEGFERRVVSKINCLPLNGTDGLCWYDFVQRGHNVGKSLLSHEEWLTAAVGSPAGISTNLHAWVNGTACVKTAATAASDADINYIQGYNTSFKNIRDCVGNLWEWSRDFNITGSGWNAAVNSGENTSGYIFGNSYNTPGVALQGGWFAIGGNAGPRTSHHNYAAWSTGDGIGGRFCCKAV